MKDRKVKKEVKKNKNETKQNFVNLLYIDQSLSVQMILYLYTIFQSNIHPFCFRLVA